MDITPGLFALRIQGQDRVVANAVSINPSQNVPIAKAIAPIKNPWIELHDGTVHDGLSLANWELKIPQYGCSCKKFYAEWKAENAPDFTSPDAFFAWGVALHNAVNRKLGKPELTIDEAKSIWRKSDGLESTKA